MFWGWVWRGGREIVYLLLCLCRLRQWWLFCGSHRQFKPRAGLDRNKKILKSYANILPSAQKTPKKKTNIQLINLGSWETGLPSPLLFTFWCSVLMHAKMLNQYAASPSSCEVFWNLNPCNLTALMASEHHSRGLLVTNSLRSPSPIPSKWKHNKLNVGQLSKPIGKH